MAFSEETKEPQKELKTPMTPPLSSEEEPKMEPETSLSSGSSQEDSEELEKESETQMAISEESGEPHENPDPESNIELKKQEFEEDHNSPRGVLEIPVSGSSDDSDSNSSGSFSSSSSSGEKAATTIKHKASVSEPPHGSSWRDVIENLKRKSVRRLSSSLSLLSASDIVTKRGLNRRLARLQSAKSKCSIDFEIPFMKKPSWRNFHYDELASATENFSADKLLGKGGHAEVFKGCLADGQLVAVKRLTKKKNEEERTGDFLSELGIIAHIDHPNAARLLGFGVERGLHLVLQYSPHGSLTSLIHGSEKSIDWSIRYKVALGIAEGLNYLHRGCHRRIIHRDIKASNILLTGDYEPQISDFGLAKWLPDQWAHHVVFPIEGTFGYVAPEYFMHGIVDEKTDVFAFGVLLLELITGRHAVDSSRQSLVIWITSEELLNKTKLWLESMQFKLEELGLSPSKLVFALAAAKPLLDTNNVKELADPRLGDDYNMSEMKNAMYTASLCIHHLTATRPHMNEVLQLLKGENESLDAMGKEQNAMVGRTVIVDACDLDDYTCSSYLNDLNRHRELALE